jgi:hypothetical protein
MSTSFPDGVSTFRALSASARQTVQRSHRLGTADVIGMLTCIIHDVFEKSSKALSRNQSADLPKKQSVF